jgi:Icc-related predicted phosphoesterase
MPRLLPLSDLHTEFGATPDSYAAAVAEAKPDVVILSGDIGKAEHAIEWAAKAFPERIPVAFVPGNHEFYGGEIETVLKAIKHAAMQTPNIHVLDRGALELETETGRLRILGCILWTDFCYFGEGPKHHAMHLASSRMNDYRLIRLGARRLTPQDTLEFHKRDRAWLENALKLPFDGQTAVVTHHAPSTLSAHPGFPGDLLTAAFGSDLDHLILKHQPAVWVHGHTHWSVDEMIGETRLISRQLGYPNEFLTLELSPIVI